MKTSSATPAVARRLELPGLVSERFRGVPAWVLLTQLFIGLGWLRAATEKVIEPSWWSGEVIGSFLVEHEALTLGWYQPFADLFVAPLAVAVAAMVLGGQLFAGASLVSGRLLAAGLAAGMFLNLNFLASGAVNPSAFYLLSQGAIALWLVEQRQPGRHTRRVISATSVGAAALGLLSIPFVSTVHPAAVIDDPAVMLILGGGLTVVACELAHHRLTTRRPISGAPTERLGLPRPRGA